jgi:hypothetical protein
VSIFAQKQGRGGQCGRSHAKEASPQNVVRNPLAHLHSMIGNQAVGKLLRQIETESAQSTRVQGNLEIRPPGDSLESDADRMADKALRMSDSPEFRKSSANSAGTKQQSSGEPLSDSLRAHYEPRFGHDFSRVRVHTDAQAAQSARALEASAYATGRDIVFGAGQFAPETEKGKNLLAHELAHVVQQDRGQAGPSIQRRLIIEGDAKDADLALRVLEPGSGLTLQRDKKTGEVSVKAQSHHPPSPSLEKELLTIINDPKQDAEISVMQKKDPPGSNIEFGEFPVDAPDYDAGVGVALVQQVRIDEVAALEKGVPGAGAYTLSHEIWENFSAHTATELASDKNLKGQKRAEMHNRAHPLAEAQANLVAGELIGPGERKAFFQVPIEVGKPPKLILRHVEDMRQYFLVWDTDFGSDTMLNVHKADRIQVSKYTLQGPDSVIIAKIVEDMKKNPTATAHFEGFAGGKKSPQENQQAALANVFLIEEIVFQTANQSDVVSHFRFFEDGNSTTNKDSVVVTIERPSK